MPADRVERSQYDVRSVAGVMDFLILDDVRPASEITLPEKPLAAVFTTYDGLRVDMKGAEKDGSWWFVMHAAAADRDPKLDELLKNKGKDSDVGRMADQIKTADAVAKEIEDFNARTKAWAYKVTDFKTMKLRATLADITDERKPEEKKPENAKPATDATDADKKPEAPETEAKPAETEKK